MDSTAIAADSPSPPINAVVDAAQSSGGGYLANRIIWLALAFAVLAVCSLAIDLPVAKQVRKETNIPGDLRRIVNLFEVFAHGAGVVVIGITIYTLDPFSRRKIARLMCCALTPGMLANVVKVMIERARPYSGKLPRQVLDSFGEFGPWLHSDWTSNHAMQSFPSGHTCVAVGLAIGLGWCYPRGRWLFALFAACAALQRIVTGAHYPSDTLGGAALACFAAACFLDDRILGRFFNRYESLGDK